MTRYLKPTMPWCPPVTVLMSVYNGMPFLPEAVESILNQNLGDFELLVVEDGSTDPSREWLLERRRADSRIGLLLQANTGLTRALNRGLRFARGRVCCADGFR